MSLSAQRGGLSNPAVVPAYGAYRLGSGWERLRAWAPERQSADGGSWLQSLLRRLVLIGRTSPIDLQIFPGIRARIYPRTNRCEKAVLVAARSWDAAERRAIAEEIRKGRQDDDFVFIDAGANVGFYSLFVARTAADLSRKVRIVAIEPDEENLRRLRTNIAVNGFAIDVLPVALDERARRGALVGGEINRGERRLAPDEGDGGLAIITLQDAARAAGVTRIDCLKIDIEGRDHAVLRGFFAEAPRTLWPKMIVAEVGRDEAAPVETLCLEQGYALSQRTRLNVILDRRRD